MITMLGGKVVGEMVEVRWRGTRVFASLMPTSPLYIPRILGALEILDGGPAGVKWRRTDVIAPPSQKKLRVIEL